MGRRCVSLKRILFILISVVLAISIASTASAASKPLTIKVAFDGKAVDFGSHLILNKGKVFIEYGALLKQLGYETQFEKTTQTIHAKAEGIEIDMSVGGDVAFINGQTVASTGEVITLNGQTWIGLRFIGTHSSYKVEWSSKTQTVSLTYQGPTAEQKDAVYDVFNKLLLIEAAGDPTGLATLMSDDTVLDTKSIQEQWKNVQTKTVVENKYIESYTDKVAVAVLVENTTKVGGAFFPDNRSQNRYTLHKGADGKWKLYNVEVLAVEYTNIPGLFTQDAALPEADKAAIGKALEDQTKAANGKNVDAYMATLADFPDKETVRKSLEDFFKTATLNVTIEKWTIVEYNGSDKASLLASLITEVDANGTKTKVRGVILNEAVKVGDKWLLNADAASLSNEQL
jgi:hypothetical protein